MIIAAAITGMILMAPMQGAKGIEVPGGKKVEPMRLAPAPIFLGNARQQEDRLEKVRAELESTWAPAALAGVQLEGRTLELVAELDGPLLAARAAATDALASPQTPLEQIFAALSRLTLSVEQRERLLEAARRHILEAPRGALGVQMEQPLGIRPGIRLRAVIPGMPAIKVLEPGDFIDAIDDQPIANQTDLVTIVQMKRPGEVVRLSIARPEHDERGREKHDAAGQIIERRLEVEVTLGAASDLARGDRPMVARPSEDLIRAQEQALRQAAALFGATPVNLAPPAAPDTPAAP